MARTANHAVVVTLARCAVTSALTMGVTATTLMVATTAAMRGKATVMPVPFVLFLAVVVGCGHVVRVAGVAITTIMVVVTVIVADVDVGIAVVVVVVVDVVVDLVAVVVAVEAFAVVR